MVLTGFFFCVLLSSGGFFLFFFFGTGDLGALGRGCQQAPALRTSQKSILRGIS